MKTTGLFSIHRYEIKAKYGETFYLLPFGDIHRFAPLCDVERWLAYLKWAKTKKNAYFLGMGDYDDLASTSERTLLSDKKFHESTLETLDNLYKKNTLKLAKELEFMRGKLIGLLGGNHYAELQSGINTDQLLADHLNTKFLGVAAFIRLSISSDTKHRGSYSIDIFAHHGRGSGQLAGATINSVEKMMNIAEADIFLSGHDHQKGVRPIEKLTLSEGNGGLRLSKRKIMLGRTGSFLKGYVENHASYIVDIAARPTELGVIKIEITPRRIQKDGDDRMEMDIHASV